MKKTSGRSIGEFKSTHAPEADVAFLRARIAELEQKRDAQKLATGEAMEIVSAIQASVKEARPQPMQYKALSTTATPITHVMHITDLHYGAVTEADEVDGFGEFSPEIARHRIVSLANAILNKTHAQRKGYCVPNLHIIGTADYISGDIHQELQVTNAFPCPQQAAECGYLIGDMVGMLAPHFENVTVDLITLDNHGRLTRKPQSSQGGLNNWCYVVAQIVRLYLKNLTNVTINIHSKPSALIKIGSEAYLAFHGHQIKGWSGIPYYGLDRRTAMEAVKRMGMPDIAFTKLLSGHLHHAVDGMYWRTGGSLSGTDAHDHNVGRKSPPHQTSWFVHPKHGEFDFTRWWL